MELNERGLPGVVTIEDEQRRVGTNGDEQGQWRVEAVGEVWRVDDEWWRQLISRRYIEVMLEGGKHVVLFEDLSTHEWFLQRL